MPSPPEFLVADDHDDNRFLLTKTLLRKFPHCGIYECVDSATALKVAVQPGLTAAIVHRARDMDGLTLIRAIREVAAKLPILAVSGYDRRDDSLCVGATAFLHYDAWLSVGTAVEDMLRVGDKRNPNPALNVDDREPFRALV